jgi:hypothetical protein
VTFNWLRVTPPGSANHLGNLDSGANVKEASGKNPQELASRAIASAAVGKNRRVAFMNNRFVCGLLRVRCEPGSEIGKSQIREKMIFAERLLSCQQIQFSYVGSWPTAAQFVTFRSRITS